MAKTKEYAWLLLTVGALSALAYTQLPKSQGDGLLQTPNGRALIEAFEKIQKDYLHPLSQEELERVLEGSIQGMVKALGDPHTSYYPPQVVKAYEKDQKGERYGIGAAFSPARRGGTGAQVEGVVRGLPAERAGIRPGDVILEVDGEDVAELPLGEILARIRKEEGTKVVLTVQREGMNAPLRFELVRKGEETAPITQGMIGDIGYVSIKTLAHPKVGREFYRALHDLRRKGAKGLILDLRDNEGGYLGEGCAVVSAFLKEGLTVMRAQTRDGTQASCRTKGPPLWTGPIVVLVNRHSASVAEIVAGALQDYRRGKLIGERTAGKGVGQIPYSLPGGGKLALTAFEWFTPKGRSVNGKGLQPDIEVEDTQHPTPLSFQGVGAPPGAKITLTVGGKTVEMKADSEGRFSYREPERGKAVLDPEGDAILKRALLVLSSGER